MKINNKTKIFLSVSANPGNFGATVFNELFNYHNINAVYLPKFAFDPSRLTLSIRDLQISGCSVSMPLKEKIIPFLDILDHDAKAINSVNTILNLEGNLKGYNTDYYGFLKSIESKNINSILIYGAGSVVNSLVFAAKSLGVKEIFLVARSSDQALEKANKLNIGFNHPNNLNIKYDLLVNATPSGSDTNEEIFNYLSFANKLFDLRVLPQPSLLEIEAKELKLETIAGLEMAKWQLQRQFEIYTGNSIAIEQINEIIQENYLK